MGKNSRLFVVEKLMTHGTQTAESNMKVELNGPGSSAQIVSRSVAKDGSGQVFHPAAVGNAKMQCPYTVRFDNNGQRQGEIHT